MSRFYGEVQGNAVSAATARGTAKTGLEAHVRGWDIGVEVRCVVDMNGDDVIELWETGGSNSPEPKRLIKRLTGQSKE